jgi:hypothetical protein
MITKEILFNGKGITRLMLLLMILLVTCNTILASVNTWDNVSKGKFYKYSVSPTWGNYPDHWPVTFNSVTYSDGSKLTDEQMATAPTDGYSIGWYATAFTITVDLGKSYTISHVYCSAASLTTWGIYFPGTISVSTSTDGTNWTAYNTLVFPSNTSTWSTYQAVTNGGTAIYRDARYVKYSVPAGAAWVFLDEIGVGAGIVQTQKYVPATGCYQGCYSVDSYGYMNWQTFESMISPKTIKMILWYADFSDSFQNQIGYLIDTPSILEGRYLQVGFELGNYITAAQVADGTYDQFLADWFTACKDKDYPIWLRPMSEMNGEWTWPGNEAAWGGIPLDYRRAWRRMYNIAEAVGCAGTKQIWDWSPNGTESGAANTDMALYYPGDNYVDWVGISVYNSGRTRTPTQVIAKAYGLYSNKPMLVSEGGCSEVSGYSLWKGDTWITNWFSCIQNTYPQIKAAVWYNCDVWAITTSTHSQQHYHDGCQSSYWLGQ